MARNPPFSFGFPFLISFCVCAFGTRTDGWIDEQRDRNGITGTRAEYWPEQVVLPIVGNQNFRRPWWGVLLECKIYLRLLQNVSSVWTHFALVNLFPLTDVYVCFELTHLSRDLLRWCD